MAEIFLVRYGEIALKGRNRNQFEQQLLRNLEGAVRNLGADVNRLHGRFVVSGPEEQAESIARNLGRVFGVVSFSSVREAELDLEAIKTLAGRIFSSLSPDQNSFKIQTHRANKCFPYRTPEINRLLGAYLQHKFPALSVVMENPAVKLSVEIGYEKAYLYLDRVNGPGGLPVGSSGRCLLLLSGGIDSPVAGWLAMKRGLALEALHFHSFPFTSLQSREKTADLCRRLALYGGKVPLHLLSVTEIQKALRKHCPPELGVILLRRMMLRLATILSARRNLETLVSGENLGQVASQTLPSISVIGRATEMTVLRPLIALDKQEIITMARQIGTYDISIRPYEDCCTLFVPRNPATRPKSEVVERAERNLDMEALLEESLHTLETEITRKPPTVF